MKPSEVEKEAKPAAFAPLAERRAWQQAHDAERASRLERRTLEAQADIAAAHALDGSGPAKGWTSEQRDAAIADLANQPNRTLGPFRVAMQEVDRAAEQALEEHRNAPTAYRSHQDGDVGPAEVVGLETVLSNAAIADTPAVKQYGCAHAMEGSCPKCTPEVKRTTSGCKGCDALTWEVDNGKALILRGDDLARYQALCAAARNAQDTARAAKTAAGALMGAFQALCAGVAPAKEP